jgi:hypothetical protein
MWTQYRRWRRWCAGALMTLAYCLITLSSASSAGVKAGVIIALCVAVAYLAEEVIWIARRQGRPCGHCGQKVPMKAFRVMATCPHCGEALE